MLYSHDMHLTTPNTGTLLHTAWGPGLKKGRATVRLGDQVIERPDSGEIR